MTDRLIFRLFLVFIFCMPLPFGSNRDWAWGFFLIWAVLLVVMWAWHYLAAGVNGFARAEQQQYAAAFHSLQRAWPFWLLWLAWLGYQAWALLFVSVDAYASFGFLLKSLLYACVFFLSLALLNRERRIKALMITLIWSGFFQAAYGAFMTLSGLEYGFFIEKSFYREVATGTFINRNHLAGYLEMVLAIGLGYLLSGTSHERPARNWRQRLRKAANYVLSRKFQYRVFLAVMVIALVLTHSRMGNTAFFSSLLVAGGLWFVFSGRQLQKAHLVIFVSILVIDVLIVSHWFGVEKVVERLEQTSADTSVRDELFRDTLVYAEDRLPFGSGAGTFRWVFPLYRSEETRLDHWYAHNDYAQFLAETGIPGLVLASLFVLMALFLSISAMIKRRHRLMRGLGLAAFMGILAILIHSTVDFNLQIPANAALFVILIAFSVIARHGFTQQHMTRQAGSPHAG